MQTHTPFRAIISHLLDTLPGMQEQKPNRIAQAAVAGVAALMLAAGPAISADKESLRCVSAVGHHSVCRWLPAHGKEESIVEG